MSELRTPAPQVGRFGAPQVRQVSAVAAADTSERGLTETELLNAHRSAAFRDDTGVEVRGCVCGGKVKASPDLPAKGVQAHNYTSRHKAWRLNRGEDDPGTWGVPEA